MFGGLAIDVEEAPCEPGGQISRQPREETVAAFSRRHQLDSSADFREGRDAQEDAVLLDLLQPGDNVRIRLRLHPLGDHVGIEQEAHRSSSRGLS